MKEWHEKRGHKKRNLWLKKSAGKVRKLNLQAFRKNRSKSKRIFPASD